MTGKVGTDPNRETPDEKTTFLPCRYRDLIRHDSFSAVVRPIPFTEVPVEGGLGDEGVPLGPPKFDHRLELGTPGSLLGQESQQSFYRLRPAAQFTALEAEKRRT